MAKSQLVSKKAIASLLSAVFLLCSILLVFGFVFKNTNGLSENLSYHTLTYDGNKYSSGVKNNFDCSNANEYLFKIDRYFENKLQTEIDYTVAFYPYSEAVDDFNVEIAGQVFKYSELTDDLSRYFRVAKTYDSFSFTVVSDFSYVSMLKALYGDVTISNKQTKDTTVKMVVTFADSSIPFEFYIKLPAEYLELSDFKVVF